MKTEKAKASPVVASAECGNVAGTDEPQGAAAPSATPTRTTGDDVGATQADSDSAPTAEGEPTGKTPGPAYVRDRSGRFRKGNAGRQQGCRNRENRLCDEVYAAPLPRLVEAGGPLVVQAYRRTLYQAMKGDDAARMEVLRLQRARPPRIRKPRPPKSKGGRGFNYGRLAGIIAQLERVRV